VPTAVIVSLVLVLAAGLSYASFRVTVALLTPHYQLVIISQTHTPAPRRITIRPRPRTSYVYVPAPAVPAPPPAPSPVANQPTPTHKPHPSHPPHPSATPSETGLSTGPSPVETQTGPG
jgi:hypothetical protein